STWLFRIASNLVIDHWRKKKIPAFSLSHPLEDDGHTLDVPDDKPSVVRKFELAELRRQVERALEKLPAPLRELFVWRHVNGLSYEEMAEIKKLPVGTVKNRVYQAKEAIRRLLEETP
ncbi:MAG: RNA polymerase sigma factor, partial [Candidatus Aminicenantes bacterium]|nr:RNA polymerase sigma factor [Candidatus Aminicenantes bacterium]